MNMLALVLSALVYGLGGSVSAVPAAGKECVAAVTSSSVASPWVVVPVLREERLGSAPVVVAPAARDPWLREDKAQHLFMSFALTTMTFGAARAAGLDARAAMPIAAGVTLAAGVGKEIHDKRSGRFFSIRDLAFDVAGVGLGLTLAAYTR